MNMAAWQPSKAQLPREYQPRKADSQFKHEMTPTSVLPDVSTSQIG
jgi:hypothetical protein